MSLSMDLKVREQAGYSVPVSITTSAASTSGSSFSEVLTATYQAETNYESYFQSAANAYQVPVNLLKAMAKVESNFTADAVSCCGAQGIMQLMPATARSLGVTDAFDPQQNIMGGAKYLRQMLNYFGGDVSKAVAAYNAGPGAVKKYGGVPPYGETQNYVAKVLGYAGSDISIPTQTVSTTPSSVSAVPQAAQAAQEMAAYTTTSTQDELVEQIMQAYRSGGVNGQESVRLLLQQLLSQNDEENGNQNTDESTEQYYALKDLVLQVGM